jgi:dTDP-glucose pyrophosphorylase
MDNLSSMARDVKNSDEDLLGAMGVFKTLNYRKVGIVKMDSQNRLIALHEKSHRRRGYLANSAIYLFRPAVASLIDELPNESTDISSHFLPRAYGKLLISKLKGKFIDIGTPRDLKRARDKAYLFN